MNGKPITLRELYHAGEVKGMLDAPIVITGCEVDWAFEVKNFEITNTEIRVW